MRILLLVTDIYTHGGVARYSATLATALGECLGEHNVDVLALLDWGSRADVGVRVAEVIGSEVNLTTKVQYAWRAWRRAQQGYDLVVASHVAVAPVAALLRGWFGTPYWVACHGSEVWGRLSWLKRAALQGADLLLPVSQFTTDKLWRVHGVSRLCTWVLYNAIPADFARLLLASATLGGLGTTPPGPFLLSVGGVSKAHAYKGVDMVIRAMPRILAVVPAAHYVVVGDGDNRPELERLAEREGVARRVRFVGEIRDPQLATLYRTCDLFVMPSRVSECAGQWTGEGFGRVYVEAALAGKPVVGSRGGGAAEAVLEGKTGLLVDPFSLDEIAGAVARLLSNPEAARSMGSRAREWAVGKFTLPVMQRALEEMLEPYCRPHRARQALSIPSLLPGEKVADVGGRMRGLVWRKHGAVEQTPHPHHLQNVGPPSHSGW
jgi:glycosyltransferase involved in cell wall biosynthesis